MDNYYFGISAVDAGKLYSPKTEVLLDLPTAQSFFEMAELTKNKLAEKAKQLCSDWNERFYKPYLKYQDAGTRSHIANYSILSEHHFERSISGYRGLTKKTTGGAGTGLDKIENHKTEVVLSLTNWWFVNKYKNHDKPIQVEPKDLHATIKIASTIFAPPGAEIKTPLLDDDENSRRDSLFFDRSGLIVSYPIMIGLLSDRAFHAFVAEVCARYKDETLEKMFKGRGERESRAENVGDKVSKGSENSVSAEAETETGSEKNQASEEAEEEEGSQLPIVKKRRPRSATKLSLGDVVNIKRLRRKLEPNLSTIVEEEEEEEDENSKRKKQADANSQLQKESADGKKSRWEEDKPENDKEKEKSDQAPEHQEAIPTDAILH